MTAFTIPLTTLQDGVRHFGPAAVADAEQLIVLTIDRTVAGGLNSLDATSVLDTIVEQSNDGGGSWQMIAGTVWAGGIVLIHGSPFTTVELMTGMLPGTGRLLRATVTVSGPAIAVAGSLVIS